MVQADFCNIGEDTECILPAVRETAASSAYDPEHHRKRFTDTHVQDRFDSQAGPPGPSINYCCKAAILRVILIYNKLNGSIQLRTGFSDFQTLDFLISSCYAHMYHIFQFGKICVDVSLGGKNGRTNTKLAFLKKSRAQHSYVVIHK